MFETESKSVVIETKPCIHKRNSSEKITATGSYSPTLTFSKTVAHTPETQHDQIEDTITSPTGSRGERNSISQSFHISEI